MGCYCIFQLKIYFCFSFLNPIVDSQIFQFFFFFLVEPGIEFTVLYQQPYQVSFKFVFQIGSHVFAWAGFNCNPPPAHK
jgi:hypothetical protein